MKNCPYLDKGNCNLYNKKLTVEKFPQGQMAPRRVFACYTTSIKQTIVVLEQKITTIMETIFASKGMLNGMDMDEPFMKKDLERISGTIDTLQEVITKHNTSYCQNAALSSPNENKEEEITETEDLPDNVINGNFEKKGADVVIPE